jgi:DNA-binding GntR family transcriptional regulator
MSIAMPIGGDVSQSGSLTEKTYSTLRDDILACRLLPGEQINIQRVCSSLRVSLGAVREALARLTSEELVLSKPQKGFRVAPVCLEDLDDLTATRIEIETLCLRRAIQSGDIEWETGVVASCHRLTHISSPTDSDEWAIAHSQFHSALVASCDSQWLLRLRAILYAQSDRYRRLCASRLKGSRDVRGEHQTLADAALRRDPDTACKLIADHLRLTATRVRLLENMWEEPAGVHRPSSKRRRPIAALAR